MQLLLREGFSNAQIAISWTDAVGGLAVAPQRCLRVEIRKIGECACGKETLAHVSNGTLNAAFLFGTRGRSGRFEWAALRPVPDVCLSL